MDLIFELNGQVINPPKNWKELDLELSFENDAPSASLSSNSFEFVGENALVINNYIADGKKGGLGIFEGMCFKIYFKCQGQIHTIFDGVLDLADASAEFTCDIVKCPIKEAEKIDFLNDIADSFSFAFLHKDPSVTQGKITTNDFVDVKYFRAGIPDGIEVTVAALSIYVITKDLLDLSDDIATEAAGTAADATPVPVATLPPVTWTVGRIAMRALLIILKIAYYASIAIALYTLLKQLVTSLFPVLRIHLGMKASTMFERGCQYLGYTFKSSIFQGGAYDDMVVIPPKKDIGIKAQGIPLKQKEVGYEDNETFGDFLREMIKMFNAKIRIVGNELQFERRDFFLKSAPYTIPDVDIEFNGTNASEIPSNYYIQYRLDTTDLHSFEDYDGYSLQNKVSSKSVVNSNRRLSKTLLKNLVRKDFKYAHARRKVSQTTLEGLLGQLASTAIDLFNALLFKPVKFTKFNSIGSWLVQTDYINTPRVAIVDISNGTIRANSRSILSAETLWDNFHFIESPVPRGSVNPNGNQYFTFKEVKIPMCCDDFLIVKDNNVVTTPDGSKAVIESLKYNIFTGTAIIDFKINQCYTNNLQEAKIVDGSQNKPTIAPAFKFPPVAGLLQ